MDEVPGVFDGELSREFEKGKEGSLELVVSPLGVVGGVVRVGRVFSGVLLLLLVPPAGLFSIVLSFAESCFLRGDLAVLWAYLSVSLG